MDDNFLIRVIKKRCEFCNYTMSRRWGNGKEYDTSWSFLMRRFVHALKKLMGKECQ
jgi:hypothetical protein